MSEINVFDRNLLRQRRARASANIAEFDFLFKTVSENILERMDIIKNGFPLVLNMNDVNGWLSSRLLEREGAEKVISSDLSASIKPNVVFDEEFLPFDKESFDAVVSVLNLQMVNDLPGTFLQIKNILKPNSLFIGALLGGETLKELRQSLMEAELRVSQGFSPRVSPFADAYTMSNLMQRAGFDIPVVDSEVITVKYSNVFKLMHDLRGMGATNILYERLKKPSKKELFLETARIYQEKFADSKGMITASFEVIYLIGWTAVSR